MNTLKTHTFTGNLPGPRILIFGAIHGNEVCGPKAMHAFMRAIKSGRVRIRRGSVTFAPVCNPKAYAKNVRFIDRDLNRVCKPTKARYAEAKYANELCALIRDADVLLDIHSISAFGKPFAYVDYPTRQNRAWAKALDIEHAIVGWPQLFKKTDAVDAVRYAHEARLDALLVECGQHRAKQSVDAAYSAILRTLVHYGIVDGSLRARRMPRLVRITVQFLRREGEQLAKQWHHLDRVRKGEALVLKNGDIVVKSPRDGYVIMPKYVAKPGEDWLYFGVDA